MTPEMRTIMIVDDDAAIRETLVDYLTVSIGSPAPSQRDRDLMRLTQSSIPGMVACVRMPPRPGLTWP